MKNYKALILDDQIENVELIKIYLQQHSVAFAEIYTATTLKEAISICVEKQPEILFLDISLGNDETSFSIIQKCSIESCEIIFISSYDKFAIQAIDYSVCAYLIKPISAFELMNVVDKAIKNLRNKQILKNTQLQLDNLNSFSIKESIIAIPAVDKISILNIEEVIYCEADGKYTKFYLNDDTDCVSSRNIGEYEDILILNSFFRVHYKFIINMNYLSLIDKRNGYYCLLKNGKNIPISRRRQEAFNKFLRLKI